MLVAYISVTTVATLDSYHTLAPIDRDRLGLVIITINIIINSGCAFLMGVKILQQCWKTYKIYSEKKHRKVHAARNVPSLNPNSHQSAHAEFNEGETIVNNSLLKQSVLNLTADQSKSNISNNQGLVFEMQDLAISVSKPPLPLMSIETV